jgi:hypothetical protein
VKCALHVFHSQLAHLVPQPRCGEVHGRDKGYSGLKLPSPPSTWYLYIYIPFLLLSTQIRTAAATSVPKFPQCFQGKACTLGAPFVFARLLSEPSSVSFGIAVIFPSRRQASVPSWAASADCQRRTPPMSGPIEPRYSLEILW